MKQVVEQVLIEESFCVDHLGTYTVKMTIKATKSCIVKLIVEGASAAEITEMTPCIALTPVLLISDKLDQACQVVEIDIVDSSLKMLFENYLQDIGCTEAEAQAVVSGLEKERSFTGKSAHPLQVIRNVNFDWDKCLIKVLEDHLQEKNLELELLDDNPVLFLVFKRKMYSKFRDSFQAYRPLLELVNIKFYRWQVIWLWEYLVNIPITADTYEHIYTLIDL